MSSHTSFLRLVEAQVRSKVFIARELAHAWLSSAPPLRILFSNREGWVEDLQRKLRLTRHAVTFGTIQDADLDRYDLIVPLSTEDLRYLSGLRPTIHNLVPLPDLEAIELCDDKARFAAHLAAHGFARWLPRSEGPLTYPYVLKRIRDESGKHCHIVTDPDTERALAAVRAQHDYLTQEFVPGRREYAIHILYLGGRVQYALGIEYGFHTDFPIKLRDRSDYEMLCGCAWLPLFERMLAALRFQGLCCINYKLRAGMPLVFEINPRLGRSAAGYFFAFLRHLPRR